MRFIEPEHRSVYYPLLAAFFCFGVNANVIGATLPPILDQFGWSYVAAGLVIAANSAGYLVSAFVSGLLVHRVGRRVVGAAGQGLLAVGLAMFAAWPSPWLNGALFFLVGMGGGSTELVVNSAIVRMERGGQSRLMNVMHAMFAVGAIAGPLVAGRLLAVGGDWRVVFRVMAATAAGLGATLAVLPYQRLGDDGGGGHEPVKLGKLLRQPVLVLCSLILMLYVAAEMGAAKWISAYYTRVLGSSESTGAYALALFWAGLLVGRFAIGVAYRGSRLTAVLLVLGTMMTAGFVAATAMGGPVAAAAAFAVAGLGCSAIYPVTMSLVGRHAKGAEAAACGTASMAGAAGEMTGPLAMSAIAERFGLRAGFVFYAALSAVMLACIVGVWNAARGRGEGGGSRQSN
jgi:fucose permease